MFAIKVPSDHPLASTDNSPITLSPNTRRYPKPDYVERDQVRRAVFAEFYSGIGSPRPRNFSPARWKAAKFQLEAYLGGYHDKD